MAAQLQDPNAQGQPLWRIGQVVDRPTIGPNGGFVDGKDVEVIFIDGSTEHLQIPKSQYNDVLIAQQAQQAADTHIKVKALQGPIIPPDLNPFS